MGCDEISALLLTPEAAAAPRVQRHLALCVGCARFSRQWAALDNAVHAAVLVQPPADLQARLHNLARAAARPRRVAAPPPSWWRQLAERLGVGGQSAQRPSFARAVAGLVLAVAGWQMVGWVQTVQPMVVGDVPYALQVLAVTPALGYLSDLPGNMVSLAGWSVVGGIAWLLSEAGPIGRRFMRGPTD
ncbi:MAG: hypothetical protein HYX52_08275 [Chloroflexi bacterium]|nr:hypothetical protein [Chloroflexota bacterium]